MPTIIVKPVAAESSQRRHQLPVVIGRDPKSGVGMSTGKVQEHPKAQGTKDRYMFSPDLERMMYRTGLLESIPNPFKGMTFEEIRGKYNLPNSWTDERLKIAIDKSTNTLARQTVYEIYDGVEYDFYTSVVHEEARPAIGRPIDLRRKKTFIETFHVELHLGSNTFTTDTSRGRMAIQLARHNPYIAVDRDSINPTEHIWYIAQENEEVIESVSNSRLENKAVSLLEKILGNYPEFIPYQTGVILGLVQGNTAPQIVEHQLNNFIKEKGSDKNDRVNKFLEVGQMFFDALAQFTVRYYVEQAIHQNILYNSGGYLFWGHYKDQEERYKWSTKETLINFLIEEHAKFNPKKIDENNAFYHMLTLLSERGVRLKE